MKKFLPLVASAVLLLASSPQSRAAIARVDFDSGSQTITNFDGITPLTGGNPGIDGDGAVLQLGYFSAATTATPFAGSWIALTGEGGANSGFANTTIGNDFLSGAGHGTFAMSLEFDTTVVGKNSMLPAAGTPLGIRIYNNTTIGTSTRFLTVANPAVTWQWVAPNDPTPPPVTLSLDDMGMRRQDGSAAGVATSSFSTLSPIPEPSTFAVGALLTVASLLPRRRRRSS